MACFLFPLQRCVQPSAPVVPAAAGRRYRQWTSSASGLILDDRREAYLSRRREGSRRRPGQHRARVRPRNGVPGRAVREARGDRHRLPFGWATTQSRMTTHCAADSDEAVGPSSGPGRRKVAAEQSTCDERLQGHDLRRVTVTGEVLGTCRGRDDLPRPTLHRSGRGPPERSCPSGVPRQTLAARVGIVGTPCDSRWAANRTLSPAAGSLSTWPILYLRR